MDCRNGIVTMSRLKKLGNPLLLVAQGFAAGAILVFTTADSRPDHASPTPRPSLSSWPVDGLILPPGP